MTTSARERKKTKLTILSTSLIAKLSKAGNSAYTAGRQLDLQKSSLARVDVEHFAEIILSGSHQYFIITQHLIIHIQVLTMM